MQDIQTEYVYKKNVTLFKELKDLSTFFYHLWLYI